MDDLLFAKEAFIKKLEAVSSSAELEQLRVRYLGKKGILPEKLKQLPKLPPEERTSFGKAVNDLKALVTEAIALKNAALKDAELKRKLAAEGIDVTLPGRHVTPGRQHPVSRTLAEIIGIFTAMGFGVEEGPEVELDYYNFELLNIPKDHPARDMQDTFYVTDDVLLRTHTSPVQVRVMQQRRPPLRIVAPGKVYRCDADVSHTPMFHQIEGLMVDKDISFSHLKGTLEAFLHRCFTPETPVRFRPSFFSFTEPSAEVDIGCIFCAGKGCRVCKGSGWIEILGAGMVNPRVFEMVGYDPEVYSGFAFGMGIERIAMLKYSINDIRLFFENDLRFLRQF
ncbi:MAG: phenylalanine--tRNA ligase subunit alpha [Thermodesulfovibrionales bacterium]|nr:phenylalanine--tRNA ligase subunit alpha [Thermodesulfovibrionales bacterium]